MLVTKSFEKKYLNKQQLVICIRSNMTIACLAPDAYVLIVQKVVESATLMDAALVGEDTDLLILLCYHTSLDSQNTF